ncbi:MAG TPA: glucose 1-dehydrogenase [Kofleriaceae bacterium]|nr:glucose 1-dehydrogenase [Kofleriaceae bacterium]
MNGRVEGKVAIITGGASGIGKGCAEHLAREGARVVVVDRARARGEQVAAALGAPHRFVLLDVTDEAGWTRLVDDTVAAFGRIDVLVNGAGLGVPGDLEHARLADLRLMWAVNVEGVFLGSRAVFPVMKQGGGGSIINISSVAGLVADPNLAGYCATKGAVRLLSKSIALSGAKLGVRCNSVHPSFIDTPMVDALAQAMGGAQAAQAKDKLARAAPVGRLGEVDEVAHLVVYLASDESRFTTGAELVIDGGLTAR